MNKWDTLFTETYPDELANNLAWNLHTWLTFSDEDLIKLNPDALVNRESAVTEIKQRLIELGYGEFIPSPMTPQELHQMILDQYTEAVERQAFLEEALHAAAKYSHWSFLDPESLENISQQGKDYMRESKRRITTEARAALIEMGYGDYLE